MGIFSRILPTHDTASQPGDGDSQTYPEGMLAKRFFTAVDRAAKIQEPAIRKYVEKVEAKHSDKSLAERQRVLDKHFRNLATGTGAGTGGIAAVPGIGTIASIFSVTGESVALLELCGFYALASAELQGLDISTEEFRRSIVLLAVSGATDKDLINALTQTSSLSGVRSLRGLARANNRELIQVNGILRKIALKQIRRRFGGAFFRKILPLGIGVALGARANRKIANEMIDQVHDFIAEQVISPS